MSESVDIKLKICGMRQVENISEVVKFAPEYMGFIFFKDSKRFVGDDFQIPEILPSTTKRVGVFVNESRSEIILQARKHRLELIQLHGDESIELCNELRGEGLKVVKVFSIDNNFEFSLLTPYKKFVDYFLFDTRGNYYGGNGVAFDWTLLEKYDQEIPFFLSGGITPQNVGGIERLTGMNLHALDVNSGVERKVGIKDTGLIEELVLRINNLK